MYKYLIVHTLMGVLCMHLLFKGEKEKTKQEKNSKESAEMCRCVVLWIWLHSINAISKNSLAVI